MPIKGSTIEQGFQIGQFGDVSVNEKIPRRHASDVVASPHFFSEDRRLADLWLLVKNSVDLKFLAVHALRTKGSSKGDLLLTAQFEIPATWEEVEPEKSEERTIVEEIAQRLDGMTYELGLEDASVSDFYINVPVRDVKHAGQMAQQMRRLIMELGADKFLVYG